MVIITADDYGKNRHATDSIYECFSKQRITSASAMVFMEDSARAASIASESNLELGLHLNFTMPFDAPEIPSGVRKKQVKVISYLASHKLAQAIYNPFSSDAFRFLYNAQVEEFMKLYGRAPDFYNGHHHMHLCANMLRDKLIQNGTRVRRTFKFERGEKNLINRLYRSFIDSTISERYISTDRFFSIAPVRDQDRLKKIFKYAKSETVEIEVHPENTEEKEFLLSERYGHLIDSVHVGDFKQLHK